MSRSGMGMFRMKVGMSSGEYVQCWILTLVDKQVVRILLECFKITLKQFTLI